MLDKTLLESIAVRHKAYAEARANLMKSAQDAQGASKRAIFALHRDDSAEAERLLAEASEALAEIQALSAKTEGLAEEGAYRAALEEYAEAALYRMFVATGKVGPIMGDVAVDDDAYLGGLSDLTGEIQRRQVRFATEGNVDEVARIKSAIEEIVNALLAMDLGGYLRTKFDQAKNSLRRAEDVLYETTLRRRP